MELAEAISKANEFAKTVLHKEKLSVDEVDFEEATHTWLITFGYKRELPRKIEFDPIGVGVAAFSDRLRPRPTVEFEDVYRTVRVPEDGGRLSMKVRKV